MTPESLLASYWWVLALVCFLACFRLILRAFGMVIIPDDSIGIVNKKWVLLGTNRTLPDGKIVALNGEAGLQADTLAPGVHFGLWPWQYSITKTKFLTIPQGQLGIVEAKDGLAMNPGRVLGNFVPCESYQDARKFLTLGGQRGPQLMIIPPGTYRINTGLFSVATTPVTEIPDNQLGIVTTREGSPLKAGDIAGSLIEGHDSFQNAQAFVNGGGTKGLQEQVIMAGRYYLNPKFCTVELKPLTQVPIANVGVVISFVGPEGKDVTGEEFKHGNLVAKGDRGVWVTPLDPGVYPINPYTHRVEVVPTANVVLNWATGKSEAHNLDKNLSTITVRSSDGFTFNLDVSQIIHIPAPDAPKVIARFGNMTNLVTQVLEPTIGNYFRNAAQKSDVIDFLKSRSERQEQARTSISTALADYNVHAVDTLIGDITPPDALMKTLTDKKLAETMKVTYDTQRVAEETRKELEQARAMANTQSSVVSAERQVQIKEFEAQASVKTAEGQAKTKTIQSQADASVFATIAEGQAKARITQSSAEAKAIQLTGDAEAAKTLAIGNAEAEVTKNKIESMEAGNYAVVQVAKALADGKVKLVPDIVAGGSGSNGGTLVDVLMANLIKPNGATH